MKLLRIKDLQRLAIHCGYRSESNKASRLAALSNSGAFYDGVLAKRPRGPLNILSVDVGLKNFSYSKVSYQSKDIDIKEWNVVNLHSKYGTPDYSDTGSLVESKSYMAKLAVSVVDNVLMSNMWVPNVITIENQRTRSNNSKATLPNVLLNFTFEHMLYAVFAARQTSNPQFKDTVVMPLSASKMVSFWLSRYTAKDCPYTPSRSKIYRRNMLYGWLEAPHLAPFDLSSLSGLLPSNFSSMSTAMLNTSLIRALEIEPKNTKVDDLVDSLLYNFSISRQISHHQEVKDLAAVGDTAGILKKLDQWDLEHIRFIEPLLQSNNDLYLASEYQSLLSQE